MVTIDNLPLEIYADYLEENGEDVGELRCWLDMDLITTVGSSYVYCSDSEYCRSYGHSRSDSEYDYICGSGSDYGYIDYEGYEGWSGIGSGSGYGYYW